MKRLRKQLMCDIRYQWRYGFYFIYALMTVMFIIILRLLPEGWRGTALTVTLLSDPALLGFLFIGGILQLERREGLLDALFVSPLRPLEYVVSKAVSLGVISAAAGVLIALGSGVSGIRYVSLCVSMFFSSTFFTLFGIAVSVNLKSMNAFLSINGLWEAVLLLPPLLLCFNLSFTPLEVFPGSAALALIQASTVRNPYYTSAAVLAVWIAFAGYVATRRLSAALSRLGGAQ